MPDPANKITNRPLCEFVEQIANQLGKTELAAEIVNGPPNLVGSFPERPLSIADSCVHR